MDNPDLERLEALLGRFNIFEAVGVVRQELRHSDFLAFLLDPRQSHGLGDAFVKQLLQRVLAAGQGGWVDVTLIDLDLWSLEHLTVQREWRSIDLLLLDAPHRLAVVIENKIDSSEHSDQLRRYRDVVAHEYPGFRVLGVYLTPDGSAPSEQSYVPIGYGTVRTLLEELVERRATSLDADVRTLVSHYGQMLRRHIVSESDVADLCRRIYRKHRQALDLIFEHRPDRQAEVREAVEALIEAHHDLRLNYSSKTSIQFVPRAWDVPKLTVDRQINPSERLLLFEVANRQDGLRLLLYLGPGPEEWRGRLLDMARVHPSLKPTNRARAKWRVIYQRSFLTQDFLSDASTGELKEEIRTRWDAFVTGDLPAIIAAVAAELAAWAATGDPPGTTIGPESTQT